MSGHDELVLIPEEEIDTSDISENESDVQNTKTINDQSVEMVGVFFYIFEILRGCLCQLDDLYGSKIWRRWFEANQRASFQHQLEILTEC